MFERFSRSWGLIKASAGVLSKDKELLVFPLLSSIVTLIVAAAFILPMFGLGALDGLREDGSGRISPLLYAVAFLFYLVQYTVIFFFNSALVGAAMIRLDGGDPTLRDGLRIASGKIVPIIGYAAIAATVGMILRAIQERAGFVGRIVSGFLGVAWTVASFLVVPVLVSRDIGPIDAVKESALLLKKTWGENLIGQGGVGLVFGFIFVALTLAGVAAIVGAAFTGSAIVIGIAVAAVVIALLVAALIQAALSGIYSAALYRYASGEGAVDGFDTHALEHAFATKK
ncbi:MAG: DUF6159 family protein [Lysobacteraceae bacterium]